MNAVKNLMPRIVRLADQLVDDIAARGLVPGDPYVGTAEAARQLGVSATLANGAMRLLVQRRVLSRKQRLGTFVGDPAASVPSGFACVHLLVRQDYLAVEGLLAEGRIVGLQGALPGTKLQFNFLPASDEEGFVGSLIADASRTGEPHGFVLVRTSAVVQRLVEDSGLPAVVNGALYPSINGLPAIGRDQKQSGRLLAEHVLANGARGLVVVLREQVRAADHAFLDGIFEVAAARSLSPAEITVRYLPAEPRIAVPALEALLAPKMGVICRSQPLGEAAVAAVAGASAAIRRSTRIAIADVYRVSKQVEMVPRLDATISTEEVGRQIGELLLGQLAREPPENRLIPVRLVIPGVRSGGDT